MTCKVLPQNKICGMFKSNRPNVATRCARWFMSNRITSQVVPYRTIHYFHQSFFDGIEINVNHNRRTRLRYNWLVISLVWTALRNFAFIVCSFEETHRVMLYDVFYFLKLSSSFNMFAIILYLMIAYLIRSFFFSYHPLIFWLLAEIGVKRNSSFFLNPYVMRSGKRIHVCDYILDCSVAILNLAQVFTFTIGKI